MSGPPDNPFVLRTAPFTRFGSYLVVNTPPWERPLGPGVYLETIAARKISRRPLFRVELLDRDGNPRDPANAHDGACWPLDPGPSAPVSACFESAATIRFAGAGVLRLTMPHGPGITMHPADRQNRVINCWPSLLKLLIEPLEGTLTVAAGPGGNVVVTAAPPTPGGRFDLAVTEFQSTAPAPRHAPFADAAAAVRRELDAWTNSAPPTPPQLAAAARLAAYTLWSCTVEPRGLHKRNVVYMSKVWMSQVWSWDHCFNAIALAGPNPQLAWEQLWALFDHQDDFGCLPDSVNPVLAQFNYCKPPVHGWAVRKMWQARPDFFDDRRLWHIYSPLCRWSRWWLQRRRGPGELPHYLHGNDSGWDNSTMFNRGVPLAAPDLTALLAVQTDALADLAARLGLRADESDWRGQSRELVQTMLRELWRDGRFVARVLPTGQEVRADTLIFCVPLVLGRRLPQHVRDALAERLGDFLTDHGLATELPSSPHYSPDGYWRGPIWAPPTMLIVDGLRDIGRHELADEIARRFCRLCAAEGFAENFDALTGQSRRDPAYSWTAAVFQCLAADLARRP